MSKGSLGKFAVELARSDVDCSLEFALYRLKMRRGMVPAIHGDDDTEEAAQFRHDVQFTADVCYFQTLKYARLIPSCHKRGSPVGALNTFTVTVSLAACTLNARWIIKRFPVLIKRSRTWLIGQINQTAHRNGNAT